MWFMICSLKGACWCLYLTLHKLKSDWTSSHLSAWRRLPKKSVFAETCISECHEREMNPGVQLYKYLTLLPGAPHPERRLCLVLLCLPEGTGWQAFWLIDLKRTSIMLFERPRKSLGLSSLPCRTSYSAVILSFHWNITNEIRLFPPHSFAVSSFSRTTHGGHFLFIYHSSLYHMLRFLICCRFFSNILGKCSKSLCGHQKIMLKVCFYIHLNFFLRFMLITESTDRMSNKPACMHNINNTNYFDLITNYLKHVTFYWEGKIIIRKNAQICDFFYLKQS